MAIAGRRRVAEGGTPVQQCLEESDLHTGLLRMDAGRDQTERGASAAVGVRLRIYIGARIQQQIGDLDNVRRASSAGSLRRRWRRRNAAEWSGARAWSARAPAPGCSASSCRRAVRIAADNGVGGRFECRDRRVGARQFLDVSGEFRPARESVFPRDEELRAGQRAPGQAFSGSLELVPAALDLVPLRAIALCAASPIGRAVQARKSFDPACGPVADRTGVARFAGLLQVLGELLILFEVGTGR